MQAARSIFFNLPALTGAAIGIVLAALACGVAMRTGRKLLCAILCAALLLHLAVFLNATLAYVKFPYEGKSVVEGVALYNGIKYLEGEQPYRPPEELPFRSLVYPPVHEMALAGVVALLGPSLCGGRLFSLLCTIATALVAAWVVWRHTRSREPRQAGGEPPRASACGPGRSPALPAGSGAAGVIASIFAGMFFICCYGITGHWIEQVRNDALLAFLVLLGLCVAERALSRDRLPILGGLILLLALYTKQTALFAPVAVAGCLWFRSRRRALAWAGSFTAAAIAVFAAMQIWSHGWFGFYVLRVPASVGVDLRKLDLASVFFGGTWIATWGILVGMIPRLKGLVGREKGDAESGGMLWTLAFLLALPLCLLQSVKWGAALNAFAPLAPLMAVLAGLSLHSLLSRFREREWVGIGILAAAAMQVAVISYRPILPTEVDFASQRRLAEWVRAAPGDVFVSVFSSQAYLNGKEYFGDNVPIGDLAKGRLWRGGELVEKAERAEFAVMILRPRVEPEDLARAVRENYVPAERIPMRRSVGGWPYMQVYVPRNSAWKPDASTGEHKPDSSL